MRFDEFRGSVSAATPTTLTDENQNFFSSSNYVPALRAGLATLAVVNGNGLGQTRLITAVSADGKTLTIDHPWDVQPEQNAHYATFDWSAENWTVAKNQLIGNFKGIELFNASGNNLLIESNTLTDSDGIMISPTENAPGTFNLVTNLDIVGNLLVDQKGLRPAFIDLTPREDQQSASFGTQIIGAAIRGNSVIGFVPNPRITNPSWDDYKIKSEGYLCSYYWQSYGGYDSSNQAPLLGAIFQGNAAWNASSAFSLNSGAVQTSISDSFLLNSGALDDNPLPGAAQGSVNTAFLDSLSLLSIGGAAPIASATASTDTPFRAVASVNGTRAVEVDQPTGYSMAATGDNIQFLSRQLSGQSDAVVHVSMMPGATGNGMLMMRSSTAQDSAFLGIGLSNGSIVLQARLAAGGGIQSVNFPFDKPDVWLKLQNKGQLINAMYSQDGRTWQTHPNAVLFPGSTYLAGVTEISNGADQGSHVIFDSLTLGTSSGGATGPPVLTGSSGRTHNPFKRALKAAGEVAVALWRAVRSFVIRIV